MKVKPTGCPNINAPWDILPISQKLSAILTEISNMISAFFY